MEKMIDCNVCDMDCETRLALTVKAEELQVRYNIEYWKSKDPPPAKDFLLACENIASLTGLVIKLLEEEVEL
jgi:hypothetical protein